MTSLYSFTTWRIAKTRRAHGFDETARCASLAQLQPEATEKTAEQLECKELCERQALPGSRRRHSSCLSCAAIFFHPLSSTVRCHAARRADLAWARLRGDALLRVAVMRLHAKRSALQVDIHRQTPRQVRCPSRRRRRLPSKQARPGLRRRLQLVVQWPEGHFQPTVSESVRNRNIGWGVVAEDAGGVHRACARIVMQVELYRSEWVGTGLFAGKPAPTGLRHPARRLG